MARLIERVFDPLEFKSDDTLDPSTAANDINQYLRRDGLEVLLTQQGAKLVAVAGASVVFVAPATFRPASHEFISEHLAKCEAKLRSGDFPGAITNARSLCEAVLCDIEGQLDASAPRYDGDLPRLYKRARKLLNMEPDAYNSREDVVQILRGLTSVVDGLSGMSNALGDRHGGGAARPKPHHAHLAVNTANTLCTFVLASFAAQNLAKSQTAS